MCLSQATKSLRQRRRRRSARRPCMRILAGAVMPNAGSTRWCAPPLCTSSNRAPRLCTSALPVRCPAGSGEHALVCGIRSSRATCASISMRKARHGLPSTAGRCTRPPGCLPCRRRLLSCSAPRTQAISWRKYVCARPVFFSFTTMHRLVHRWRRGPCWRPCTRFLPVVFVSAYTGRYWGNRPFTTLLQHRCTGYLTLFAIMCAHRFCAYCLIKRRRQ